jgi:hypothetical protein
MGKQKAPESRNCFSKVNRIDVARVRMRRSSLKEGVLESRHEWTCFVPSP